MPTFIDSSFWIALRSRADVNHAAAVRAARALAERRELLFSTDLVFSEIHAYFSRMLGLREQVITDFWESRLIQFQEILYSDKTGAIALLREHQDKTYSFCDAVSFVLMQRLHVSRVACFDEHFRQFGPFELVA